MIMAGQPESQETTAGAAPPVYKDIYNTRPSMDHKPQPGPALNGKFYHDDKRAPSMTFIFGPAPFFPETIQEWAALMTVKCNDVPYFMREGFYWDESNVVREEGYMDSDFKNSHRLLLGNRTWYGTRHYFLQDMQQQPPSWIATIEVFAMRCETLARFSLDRLSFQALRIAGAQSRDGKDIYSYLHDRPDRCFNMIYDDMPLRGRWPWPRKELWGLSYGEKS
ncbi:hypothetical protein F4861DRAFT_486907 [Xylaria intraflava]|nr:hypothetical protein F4861DRAFT_486907 [Xylaria intraflava]